MDDCTFLATPPSEPKRVFDVIDNPVLQVNYPWCGSREENTQERRRGCGMWVLLPLPPYQSVLRGCRALAQRIFMPVRDI